MMETGIQNFTVRSATAADAPLIYELVKAMAAYEKRPEDVTGTQEALRQGLFDEKIAQVLLAEYAGEVAGYALFYPVFSSFAAAGGLYLEDIFIHSHLRGKGLGKALMRSFARVAAARGYTSIQWSCLDWNEPSIRFYHHLGAKQKTGNIGFSLGGEAFARLVNG